MPSNTQRKHWQSMRRLILIWQETAWRQQGVWHYPGRIVWAWSWCEVGKKLAHRSKQVGCRDTGFSMGSDWFTVLSRGHLVTHTSTESGLVLVLILIDLTMSSTKIMLVSGTRVAWARSVGV